MQIGKQGYKSGQISAEIIEQLEERNQEIQASKKPSAQEILKGLK